MHPTDACFAEAQQRYGLTANERDVLRTALKKQGDNAVRYPRKG